MNARTVWLVAETDADLSHFRQKCPGLAFSWVGPTWPSAGPDDSLECLLVDARVLPSEFPAASLTGPLSLLLTSAGCEDAIERWVKAGYTRWASREQLQEVPLMFKVLRDELNERRARTRSADALMRLVRNPRVGGRSLTATLREINRVAVQGLGCTRAGVWLLNDAALTMTLVDCHDARSDGSTQPPDVRWQMSPTVTEHLLEHRIESITDVQNHVSTEGLRERYFGPGGTRSILTVTLVLREELVGMLCLEQAGSSRTWTSEDETFAGVLGDVASLAIESSQRSKAEKALLESQKRFSDIFKHANDSIEVMRVALDGSLFLEDINPAGERLTGMPRDIVIGRRPDDMLSGAGAAQVNRNFHNCIEARKPITFESELQLPNGHRSMSTAMVPIFDESGRVSRVAAITRDRSQQRAIEQQLSSIQKNEALARLATNLAEDIRTTLEVIARRLADVATDTTREAATAAIREATERAHAVTTDVLAFSRRRVPEKQPVEVSAVLQPLIDTLRSLGNAIGFKGPGVPTVVLGEAPQLRRALEALLTHATRTASAPGEVEVSLSLEDVTQTVAVQRPPLVVGHYVRIVIRYQASLDAETRQRLFEPFFLRDLPGGGTGLGLAVAQTCIAAHEGALFVESRTGLPAELMVYLPLAPSKPATTSDPQPRLMLVDDHPGMARVSARLLETLGYRTSVFENPHEALATFQKAPQDFDAVLTDLSMPQMSGEVFTRQVLLARPGIPIIISSGRASELDPSALEALGVQGVLVKPWRIDEAAAILKRALLR